MKMFYHTRYWLILTVLCSNLWAGSAIKSVTQPSKSPLVNFRILFNMGSAHDPKGKEGLASLTAAMLATGGTRTLTYNQIVDAMYPMATAFSWQVDQEMTVFVGSTHVDNLGKYYALISSMLLDPGFREDDFTRLKTDAINYLKLNLREGNDEELGKEQLYSMIYRGHPYGHHPMGAIEALEKLTVKDVEDFYTAHYSRSNLILGLAGGFPPSTLSEMERDFSKLPLGKASRSKIPGPRLAKGTEIQIVERDTRATAISIGFPIQVTRSHKDWVALALASSYFGQHRSSVGYLYQHLREARGLNYGDYSYIEYFPRGMFQFQPDPNLARQQQIYQLWIRPVEPGKSHFALRAALFEYQRLVDRGLSPVDFEATREFMKKNVNVALQNADARLGYALDSLYYRTPEFSEYVKTGLNRLTCEQVNRAIRSYLKTDSLRVVMVTADAKALQKAIVEGGPSPIHYNSSKPESVMEEDKLIQSHHIQVDPSRVTVIPVGDVFK